MSFVEDYLCGMELRRNEKITFRCTELEKDALAEQASLEAQTQTAIC